MHISLFIETVLSADGVFYKAQFDPHKAGSQVSHVQLSHAVHCCLSGKAVQLSSTTFVDYEGAELQVTDGVS